MNRGITKASGDYIYFLNAGDVFYDKDVLYKASEYIITADKPDILIGNYIEKRHEISKIVHMEEGWDLREILPKGRGVCHQAVFAKAACLQGGFNEEYRIVADYDWLCRKFLSGCRIEWIDLIISEYDIYGVSSLAKNWVETKEERRRIVKAYFPDMEEKIDDELAFQYGQAKNQKMQEYLSDILALKQRHISLRQFFKEHSLYEISIYGFQYLGQRLLEELEVSDIKVTCVIDRDHSFQNMKVPLKHAEDELDAVDAIVVTPIFEFYSIKQELQDRTQAEIISIEDIINSMYSDI